MEDVQRSFVNEKILGFEAKIPILKKYLNEAIVFSEKNRNFIAGTETLKEKMILSFEVSCANHIMAIRDLLFYPIFPEPGNFKKVKYEPTPLNYHAITIAVISRAILELAAILYWMLKGDEQTTSKKLGEYLIYLEFADAVNKMNALALDGQPPTLSIKQREAIKKGKNYIKPEAHQKCWKDLTPNDVRGDFYTVIDKKQGISKIVADFFDIEIQKAIGEALKAGNLQAGKNKDYFRVMYRFLSDIAHSNPYAITSMFSIDPCGQNQVTVNFRNGDPQILAYALTTALNCYGYVSEILLSTFKNETAASELIAVMNKFHHELGVL